jgi:hypothetical protein
MCSVPAVDSLTLRFGLSSGLRVIQFVAASLGAVAIMAAPAALGWKFGAWSALVFVTLWAQAASTRKSHSGSLELLQDGTMHMRFHDGKKSLALLKENAWAIRWFSVLTLFEQDSGRHYHCVVCASENAPNQYRRLLQYLNMRIPTANLQKAMRW